MRVRVYGSVLILNESVEKGFCKEKNEPIVFCAQYIYIIQCNILYLYKILSEPAREIERETLVKRDV